MRDDPFFSESEVRTVRDPAPTRPRCDACGLFRHCRSPKMALDGRGERGILICSEQPGADEDREGRPFVGGTGRFIADKLRNFGVDLRRDCWLTNALICKPTGQPPKHSIADCRPNLLRAIRETSPSVILLLGTDAVRSLIGHLWKESVGSIERWVGWQIPSIELNSWVCPTYQPAQLFHTKDPVQSMWLESHFEQAVRLAGTRPWPDGVPDYESQVEIITNVDDAAARIRKYTSGMVAFDYENNTLKPDAKHCKIVCCSVCWNGTETIAFPWYGGVRDAMRELLGNPDVGKIASNMDHEDRWTRAKLGIEVRGWAWDTMLAAHTLDPRGGKEREDGRRDQAGITGLKFQSFVRLGVGDYSHHIEPFLSGETKSTYSVNRIGEIKQRHLLKYCGLDSLLEYKLAQLQMRELGA